MSCSADCVCACLGRGCALCAALTLAQTVRVCARARACVRASLVPAPPLTHTQRRGIVAYCHVSSSTSRYRGRGAVIISNPKEHGRLLAPHPRVVRHPRKYNLTLDLMLILIISCCKLCFVIATRSTESISFSRV